MYRRGSIFWGVILIIVAGLLLLRQMNFITGDIFGYFWPLLAIAFGVWLILGYFTRNQPVAGETTSIPLEAATSAFIKFDHAAGRLNIRSGAASGELLNGTFGNGVDYKSRMDGNRQEVKLRTSHHFWAWWPGDSLDWEIHLNRDVPISLKIDSGASASILDLSDLKVTDLDIDTGASSTEVTLPASAGNTRVDIDTGASSLKLTIPAGVAASIRTKTGLSSVNVASRFPHMGDGTYQSPDYATATNRADITINAGVGSVDIN
jgi:hypothetical protein